VANLCKSIAPYRLRFRGLARWGVTATVARLQQGRGAPVSRLSFRPRAYTRWARSPKMGVRRGRNFVAGAPDPPGLEAADLNQPNAPSTLCSRTVPPIDNQRHVRNTAGTVSISRVHPVPMLFANDAIQDVLHVGCGGYVLEKLPPVFRTGWREIRLDIDPGVNPDVVANIIDMRAIADASVEAVFSSHNLEHLYPHEVPLALREMCRVLKLSGMALIILPDLQEVVRHIADGGLEDPMYDSAMGPIAPIDIV
jgi:Methyltransferase domain